MPSSPPSSPSYFFCTFDNYLSEDGFCTQSRPKANEIFFILFAFTKNNNKNRSQPNMPNHNKTNNQRGGLFFAVGGGGVFVGCWVIFFFSCILFFGKIKPKGA